MDQLKEVRDRIAERITEKKSMPLAEQIRYEKYLDCLYKMSIKTLNGEKFNENEFNIIFKIDGINSYKFYGPKSVSSKVSGDDYIPMLSAFCQSSDQWQCLNICLRGMFYNVSNIGYYYKLCEDNKVFMLYVYDQFDEVLKHMK